jgi:hypothetical protein
MLSTLQPLNRPLILPLTRRRRLVGFTALHWLTRIDAFLCLFSAGFFDQFAGRVAADQGASAS